jgi:hypothetical protein
MIPAGIDAELEPVVEDVIAAVPQQGEHRVVQPGRTWRFTE